MKTILYRVGTKLEEAKEILTKRNVHLSSNSLPKIYEDERYCKEKEMKVKKILRN